MKNLCLLIVFSVLCSNLSAQTKPVKKAIVIIVDGIPADMIERVNTTNIDDDGNPVFSPNGTLANSVIKNYTKITARRMQFTFVVSYDTNIKVAREAILSVLNTDERILDAPKKEVIVGDLKESGISLVVRAWANREVFWATKNQVSEEIKNVLDGKNVIFPSNIVKVIDETPGDEEKDKAVS